MGSKGSKPRKPNHSQHLQKVGTHDDVKHEQHEERQAVLDNMGLGGTSRGTRTVLGVIALGVVLLAILAMISWNTFH